MHYPKIKESFSFTRARLHLFVFILCIVLLGGCTSVAQRICIKQRTAFDIGSATMKMKTAKVDQCHLTIIEIIQRKEVKVPFAENTHGQILSGEIQNIGIHELQALKNEALTRDVQSFAGVATAIFRQVDNTPQFLFEIKEKTKIDIKLISQDEEAILGYKAVLAHNGNPPGKMVVWDIGGNSMQMILQDGKQNYRVYRGQTASISFKKMIIDQIHRQSAAGLASPNPIGGKNLTAALELAMNAASDVPDEIKKSIRLTGTTIIGIGGVHNQSIRKQVGSNTSYSREDLLKVLQNKLDLTDEQIGGHYADTDVSNLILVLGFMKKLGIEKVHLMDVNLTDGVLIDPAFW